MTCFAKFIDERTIQTKDPRAFVSASGTTWHPPMPKAVLCPDLARFTSALGVAPEDVAELVAQVMEGE